jgi:benzoate/toluate 1,2-dioxygenase alpha subunit
MKWNDMSRGAEHWMDGPDEHANQLHMKPLMSGAKPEDEGLYLNHYKHWQDEMTRAIEAEGARFIPVTEEETSA